MDSCKTFSVTSSTKIIALKIKVNGVQANAIIDTGATKSAISSKLAENIKLLEQGNFAVSVANGKSYFSYKTPPDGNIILLE